ncbi:MAG: glycosyltransferase [Methanomassiliicoccales archaeon]
MRIAMFTDSYLPTRDGVVSSILSTKERLEEMGHEVIVFAPDPGDEGLKEEGTVYFRSIAYKRYDGYRIPLFPTNKCEIIRDLDVDVIHSQGLLFMALRSMFAGRSLRLPVVVSFHTMITEAMGFYAGLPLPQWIMERLFWRYLRSLMERAEVVIAPTHAVLDQLRGLAPRMKRGEVIPTGVDCVKFHPQVSGRAIRDRFGLNHHKVVMHLGRIAWEKNLDLVLESFQDLCARRDDVRMMIVGEGPAKQHYMEEVISLDLEDKVIFTGFVPDEELPQFYAACDAFVLASKFETQGLVVLEAMATGKPVACIDYRATAEIVDDGVDGFLFNDDRASCSETMEKALYSPESLRRRAREKAERYSRREGSERLVGMYRLAIEQKRARDGEKLTRKGTPHRG